MRRVSLDVPRHKMTRAASVLLLRRRIQRLMPLALRWSAMALAGGCAIALFMMLHTGDMPTVQTAALRATAALGFTVDNVLVEGREMTSPEAVLAAIDAGRGTPIFGVSPTKAKQQLETLPWVRSASVERRLPGTLYVRLVERHPLALWQRHGKIVLIDAEGVVVTTERLDRYANLLLVVGDGAQTNAQALLTVLATQPDLQHRIAAAVWVGERRWNLKLDNGIDVELPEGDISNAWAQLADLDRSHGLLDRNIQKVDLRLNDRLVVRVTPDPSKDQPPAKPRAKSSAKNT
ncbi:MAG TPA: cell division protein FtsQ/DivIB [Stellaceae bacterium]|nr:cell division protein FtsQ/DivIB [Stellaceae bacterium]